MSAPGVNNAEIVVIPGVAGREEAADEGLAFVFRDQMFRDSLSCRRERRRGGKEIEDGGEDGGGGDSGVVELDCGKKRVAEQEGDAERVDVRVGIGGLGCRVIRERKAAVTSVRQLGT